MRINDGFTLRSVLGQKVIVGEGSTQINFDKLISLNDTAALLWEAAAGHDFTVDELANLLVEKYGIELEMATTDVKEITDKWIELGLATN